MFEKRTITPPKPQRFLFHLMGMGILLINKLRYAVRGYREPRPFAVSDYSKAISYDKQVVANWLDALRDYTGQSVAEKVVLELGPGADLGPALLLLDQDAKQYVTVDANRLIDETQTIFYEKLIATLSHGDELRNELEKTFSLQDNRIQYLVNPSFDLSGVEHDSVDLVVSQAAFEHFSDVAQTFEQLNSIVKKDGVLIAEVDLMTHTGVMRSRDPLNIFRYSDFFYRLLNFSGIPNRLRPRDYKRILESSGWHNVEIVPLQTLPADYVKSVRPGLARQFRQDNADMHVLTLLIRATKQ